MSFVNIVKAVLFGILEGITEWLPISSTGHLLLLERYLSLGLDEKTMDFFLVFIQLGAVLAVCFLYMDRLNPFRKVARAARRDILSLWGRVLLGCLPAGVIGILLDDAVEKLFYRGEAAALTVGSTLLLYGILFLLIEQRRGKRGVERKEKLTVSCRDALLIGCFQMLSLIPGTSRSGSTILGASALGVGRVAAAEFSFFMAIPLMLGASLLRGGKLVLEGMALSGSEWGILLIAFATAFLVSVATLRFLVDFVRRHTFSVFGWYRIVLGVFVLFDVVA